MFNYTDHLGNVRVSFAKDPQQGNVLKILEENHYYAFGLKHKNYNVEHLDFDNFPETGVELVPMPAVANASYNYKYNGKELQEELGLNFYDYGARNYDPTLGRWMNIDPLAEKFLSLSPYNYCYNNPLRFVDPDGRGPSDWIQWTSSTGVKSITFDANVTNAQQAKDKGYTQVKEVFSAKCAYNTKDIYENYTFDENGNVTQSNGSSFNVHNGDTYTTSDGTHIGKSLTGFEQSLEIAKAGGDAIAVIGLVTAQPELVALGGYLGTGLLLPDVANDLNNQGVNENTVVSNGTKVILNRVFNGLGNSAVNATQKVAGKEFVESGANKVSESIIQGAVMAGEKTTDVIIKKNK